MPADIPFPLVAVELHLPVVVAPAMKLTVTLCTILLFAATGCDTGDVLAPPEREPPDIRREADPVKDDEGVDVGVT